MLNYHKINNVIMVIKLGVQLDVRQILDMIVMERLEVHHIVSNYKFVVMELLIQVNSVIIEIKLAVQDVELIRAIIVVEQLDNLQSVLFVEMELQNLINNVITLIKLVVKIAKLILVLAAEIHHLLYVLATILYVVME